jgi:phospholipid/cholesterol/gamma-HCH transport system permease protein
MTMLERLDRGTRGSLSGFGDFCVFASRTFLWLTGLLRWKNLRLLWPQLYDIGVSSVPVIVLTGAFIGMVLAVETFPQFKAIGLQDNLGTVIILSVVQQIGPVLTAVMIAGRIGCALTAELGTMNVTEQLDALTVMGADPIRYLVVPRFMACVLLAPVLTLYSDIAGIIGGWVVSVWVSGIPNGLFWQHAQAGTGMWSINEGLIKSIIFGALIGLISCYKGFRCGPGASGVGRACTESFVTAFVMIIMVDFIFAKVAKDLYQALYGVTSII